MFQLDTKSPHSIYEQVVSQSKELILTGVLARDDRMPSVRELSRSLRINPNTVQKSFRQLEQEGYVYTVPGKGTFVAGREAIRYDQERADRALAQIREGCRELLLLGLTPDQVREEVERIFRDGAAKAAAAGSGPGPGPGSEETGAAAGPGGEETGAAAGPGGEETNPAAPASAGGPSETDGPAPGPASAMDAAAGQPLTGGGKEKER